MNHNLYAILAARFLETPETAALILPAAQSISFADLDRASARCANLLVQLGLKPGDRIAAQVEKTPQALYLYLGSLRAGCVFVPMNTTYQRNEVTYFLSNAEPGLFVHTPNDWAQELASAAQVPNVLTLNENGDGSFADALAQQADSFATVERGENDLAAILYTSGTTGRPKGAMLSHNNLAANVKTLHAYWHWQQGDVLLHMLPIFHVHGLFVAVHCALYNGSTMLFEPKFDAKRVLELLPRATVMMGVPTFYTRLLNEPAFTRDSCKNMRLFISGSAPLLLDTFNEFQQRGGHTILERYGMTEGGMFTSNPCDGERRGGTVGFPLPGVSVRVVDDQNETCAANSIGNIQVRGDNVFSGYWRLPEKTREEFSSDGYFKTGDVGKYSDDGYLTIVGRSKDLIISGGLNVYPKEIESVIDSLPGLLESAVIGIADADFGEAVIAVIVRRNEADALDAASVISALKAELANFKIPKTVYFVEALPRNIMGKVQKNILREQYSKPTA
ncbi:MAG: malonyl-CoA synthase [Verrucomicrobiaceae bacterium]|nr:malonyl-CoA synthase [Verrucomicrobiaceae bacterium]